MACHFLAESVVSIESFNKLILKNPPEIISGNYIKILYNNGFIDSEYNNG